ncbi:Hpt domain-containing protein [Marinimicrobium alkaliphilum]|uniref:Hpt domain-containing protein n=1 Tax=Marinimicrobium alkaliphilum TaxID=2202654 RepID=UPI000DB939E7|nr:Hpt domain-containing protein [Marinimicrobium alkaliphilum]
MSSEHLDRQLLEELEEVMEGEFATLIDTFIRDSAERIAALQKALASRDAEAVRRAAHSFKGSCRNLGAIRLADLCQGMEHQSAQGQLNGQENTLVDIQQEFSQVKLLLQALV